MFYLIFPFFLSTCCKLSKLVTIKTITMKKLKLLESIFFLLKLDAVSVFIGIFEECVLHWNVTLI